ncbi:ribulose-phosphate 3-epimerase [Tetragenococcus halophilus]|uniref:ribulose-phosphate 3-epimerase n=1 Tax=Tetragenococcus halophilus TaxID=51669 RepID=UPI000B929679|nr:ribulose-phosphate 3-epimerase [Tetragenococcus halophilus]
MTVNIFPSIIDAEPHKLSALYSNFKQTGITGLHIDVMDGSYVPSYGFNERYVQWLATKTNFYQDLHLMVKNPIEIVDLFIKAGANGITVHHDTAGDLYYLVNYLNKMGVNSGIAINPGEPAQILEEFLPIVHHVLVMTSNPGRSSIGTIKTMSNKVIKLNELRQINHLNFRIQIDGGINSNNVSTFISAGCDDVISGGFITKARTPELSIKQLQNEIK